jgi:thymidine kinase
MMDEHGVIPGRLEIYTGPMKSGKTRQLLLRVDKLSYMNGCDFEFMKPDIDTREPVIKSRFGKLTYDVTYINYANPYEILGLVKPGHKLVGLEEAQFFAKGIEDVVEELIRNDINVLVSGLDLDFRGEPFGSMPYLMAIADKVHKLTAVCEYQDCNSPATRTQRLVNGEPAQYDEPLVKIGDEEIQGSKNESYEARCLKHHFVPGRPEARYKAKIIPFNK